MMRTQQLSLATITTFLSAGQQALAALTFPNIIATL
jgi:hypothetical protein